MPGIKQQHEVKRAKIYLSIANYLINKSVPFTKLARYKIAFSKGKGVNLFLLNITHQKK
jgi:hypothetical protein